MLPGTSSRVSYVLGDIESWGPDTAVDIIYANASLHWIPDHMALFPRLMGLLTDGGVLAVQMPLSWDQPSHRIMRETAGEFGVESLPPPTLEEIAYYDVLGHEHAEVWSTTYLHVLEGDNPVFAWVSATGMQRFLKRIDQAHHEEYRQRCSARIARAYPRRPDGTTIFPFNRLFIYSKQTEA